MGFARFDEHIEKIAKEFPYCGENLIKLSEIAYIVLTMT